MSSPGTPPGQDKVYQVIARFKLLLGRRGDWEGRVSRDLGAACARVHVQVCGIQGALVDRQYSPASRLKSRSGWRKPLVLPSLLHSCVWEKKFEIVFPHMISACGGHSSRKYS